MSCENCERLAKRIMELEQALRDSSDAAHESEERHVARIGQMRRDLQAAEQRERDERDANYFREDQLKAVERARERGDEYTERQALERLKRGW